MVGLITLPNELLEIIVKYAVVELRGQKDYKTAGNLRRVHKRLGSFAEAYLFNFNDMFTKLRIEDFYKGRNPLVDFLRSTPARKMTRLCLGFRGVGLRDGELECERWERVQSMRSFDEPVPETVEQLSREETRSVVMGVLQAIDLLVDSRSADYMSDGAGVIGFPNLKEIIVGDRACGLLTPFISALAPAIQRIRFFTPPRDIQPDRYIRPNRFRQPDRCTCIHRPSPSDYNDEVMAEMLSRYDYYDNVSRLPEQELKRLKIHHLGAAWIRCLLERWNVRPTQLVLHSSTTRWEGDHYPALLTVAAGSGFKIFEILQDLRHTDDAERVILGHVQMRFELTERLRLAWVGRGIKMTFDEFDSSSPYYDWEGVMGDIREITT